MLKFPKFVLVYEDKVLSYHVESLARHIILLVVMTLSDEGSITCVSLNDGFVAGVDVIGMDMTVDATERTVVEMDGGASEESGIEDS